MSGLIRAFLSMLASVAKVLSPWHRETLAQRIGTACEALILVAGFVAMAAQYMPTMDAPGPADPVDVIQPAELPGDAVGTGVLTRPVGMIVEMHPAADNNTRLNWAAAAARETREAGGAAFLVGCTWTQVKDALRTAYDLLVPCLAGVGMTAALDSASQAIHVGTVDGGPILAGMEAGALGCAAKAGLALFGSGTKDIGFPRELTFVLKAEGK